MKHCKCCEKNFLSLKRGRMATVCDSCFDNTTYGKIVEVGEFCNIYPKFSINKIAKLLNLSLSELLYLFSIANSRYQDSLKNIDSGLISENLIEQITNYMNNHEQEVQEQLFQFSSLKQSFKNIDTLKSNTNNSNTHKPSHSSKLVSELQEKLKNEPYHSTYHISGEHPTHHVTGTKEVTIVGRTPSHHKKEKDNFSR